MSKPTLWNRITDSSNLVLAYRKARRGKMGKEEVLRYSRSLRDNLRFLQSSLRDGSWEPSPFKVFTIFEPKERVISAAPFCDRVAHHAVMTIVGPILDRRQIDHSYACREGKGVHACVAQAYRNQRKYSYFLRMDIRKYFPSIDHDVLFANLSRTIWDEPTLSFFRRVLHHGDSSGVGLPIGNLTSQHLANLHLSYLDHFVLQTLAPKAYVRYMDDFVLWANDRDFLQQAQQRITVYLELTLHLHPKPSITELLPARKGLLFLGCRILPNQVRLSQRSLYRLRKHIRKWQWEKRQGVSESGLARKAASVMGWTALAHTHSLRSCLQISTL